MRRAARLRLAAALGLAAVAARAEVIDIDSATLARLAADGVPVIDIRTRPEWQETGIVPGSRLLTFFDERGRADPPAWLARLREAAPAERPVILICRSGNRTRAAAQFLTQQAGYRTVYHVRDGIRGWLRDGRTTAPAAPLLAGCRPDALC